MNEEKLSQLSFAEIVVFLCWPVHNNCFVVRVSNSIWKTRAVTQLNPPFFGKFFFKKVPKLVDKQIKRVLKKNIIQPNKMGDEVDDVRSRINCK